MGPHEPNPNLLLGGRAIEDRHEALGRVEGAAAEAPHRDETSQGHKADGQAVVGVVGLNCGHGGMEHH